MNTDFAGASPVEPTVRPLAGRQKGRRVTGDKSMQKQRMTMHWVHAKNNRMYWCNCMPCFRVGSKIHAPANVRSAGRLKQKRKQLRSFLTELLAHA